MLKLFIPILIIAATLSTAAEKDPAFFNGVDLAGWNGNPVFWSVKDGAIVGHSDQPIQKNEFIWSEVPVRDFYLVVDVKLSPNERNAGIQFRSKKVNEHGQALGYQADVGAGVWGKLYHEHGRGKMDWNNRADKIVKSNEWNRYEILAIGDRIWTAINGTLCVAIQDPAGEKTGHIALQIHGGPPQTVHYRHPTLIHDPPVQLAGVAEAALNAALPGKDVAPKPGSKPTSRIQARGTETAVESAPHWPQLIAAADPGSQDNAWAQSSFDDRTWKTMNLPGHFEKAGLPDYDGVVWFRKTLALTASQANSPATLELGQIDDMDVTWVNGKRVGGYETPGHHYTPRKYTVPAGVLQPGKNVIAVRVMDHGYPGGIAGDPAKIALQLGGTRISLANEWQFTPGANLAQLNNVTETIVSGPTAKTPGFTGDFTLEEQDVVAFIGGACMVKQMESADLEALLTQAAGDRDVRFRDLAWPADTVYLRQRPRNFGTLADMLDRVGATVVMAAFGQMEAMDGVEKLPEFIAAYEQLLQEVQTHTDKIVLITPFPFTRSEQAPHLPDLTRHNPSVQAYAKAILQLAKDQPLIAVDLSRFHTTGLTTDGVQLNREGHTRWATVVTRQLLGEPAAVPPENVEGLTALIQHKNVLWKRHWRPTNWAFLYGNRQHVPSSHDHRPGKPRWFPEEINAIIPAIETAEAAILNATNENK